MNTLFDISPALPTGFSYFPDFLSMDEEETLYQLILKIDLHNMIFQGFEAKRKTASFGYDYSFDKRQLTKGKNIPGAFISLIERVGKELVSFAALRRPMKVEDFAELLVTEYPVGSVINWHRDAPPFDMIAGVSLLSDCIFKLRPHDKAKQNRSSVISFPVQRRSLYLMQGSARSEWQHSIAPVKQVRYSITLRTLKTPAQ